MNNFVIFLLATQYTTQSVDGFVRLSSSIAWRWWWNGGGNWNCETEKCDDCTRNFMQIFVTICVVFGVRGSRAKPGEAGRRVWNSNEKQLFAFAIFWCRCLRTNFNSGVDEWHRENERRGVNEPTRPAKERSEEIINEWMAMERDGTEHFSLFFD